MSNTIVIQGPEIWEPVPGFEDLYEVSNLGQIRTLDTKRNKKQTMRPDGQICVCLHGKGVKSKHTQVKLVVLAAFVGPRPENLVAVNLDGDRSNCSLGNLGYVTLSEARLIAQATRPRMPRLNKRMFAELQSEAQSTGQTVIERAALRGITEGPLRNYVRQVVMNRTRAKGKAESKGLGANFVGH